jgi:hypothetical protein
MNKKGFAVLTIILSITFCWQFVPRFVATSHGDIWDACSSYATVAGGCYVVCPQGDGPRLDVAGTVIYVVVKDNSGQPIPGILPGNIWLIGCSGALNLCFGGDAIQADSATNAEGKTTISGRLASSGCDPMGVVVVVLGVVITDPLCLEPLCLPITTVSPDMAPTAAPDGVVDIIDLSVFADGYTSPPKTYNPCIDFNCDGEVDIIDFSVFAQHYLHQC